MNVRHPVGVLHLFSIKNIFMIKSNFRFFYFYFLFNDEVPFIYYFAIYLIECLFEFEPY